MVATSETQGRRTNDFFLTAPGELVALPVLICEGEDVNGSCGCRRSLSGVDTLLATTTAQVQETDLSREEYMQLVEGMLLQGGWHKERGVACREMAEMVGAPALTAAATFPSGSILEYRRDRFNQRI